MVFTLPGGNAGGLLNNGVSCDDAARAGGVENVGGYSGREQASRRQGKP